MKIEKTSTDRSLLNTALLAQADGLGRKAEAKKGVQDALNAYALSLMSDRLKAAIENGRVKKTQSTMNGKLMTKSIKK